jgi:putative ABC transport system permease protein
MTRHLLRLVWNRKRQNLLLAFEIFLSFLVLFTVVFFSFSYYSNWRQALGFDIARVWAVAVRYPWSGPVDGDAPAEVIAARAEAARRFHQIYAALDGLPNVEASAGSWPSVPYGRGGWSTVIEDQRRASTSGNMVTDEFADLLGMEVVAGRWFSREDDAATWIPIVLNRRLAGELFGDDDPLNKELAPVQAMHGNRRMRVIGVVSDFRQEGELAPPGNYTFFRLPKDDATGEALPNGLVVRVTPDTTAEFEPILARTLESIAPDWTFEVRPLDSERETMLRSWMMPLITFAVIAGFLLLMVALGLTGVVWQSVTRRTQEFGLRRAKGATVPDVQRQVLAELLLLTSMAIVVGVSLVAQAPVLPLRQMELPDPPAAIWLASIAVSVTVIYLVTLSCAWYPSRLATRIQPAEALHYE